MLTLTTPSQDLENVFPREKFGLKHLFSWEDSKRGCLLKTKGKKYFGNLTFKYCISPDLASKHLLMVFLTTFMMIIIID